MRVREYRESDLDDVIDICIRTGFAGGDATGRYTHAGLLPDIYATPYVRREPELAFVVDDGARAVGYVLATADTRSFGEWFVQSWWSGVANRYPADAVEQHERAMIASASNPKRMLVAEVDDYPAHLHIDLLPEAQGNGWGRRLIERLFGELRERRVAGLHLTTDPANVSSHRFYERVGLSYLPSHRPEAPVMGIRF